MTSKSTAKTTKPMTVSDAARIQSATAKATGNVAKGSFPARAMSAATKTAK